MADSMVTYTTLKSSVISYRAMKKSLDNQAWTPPVPPKKVKPRKFKLIVAKENK